jgi:hypothetical protein
MLKRLLTSLFILLIAVSPALATTNMYGLLWYGQSLGQGAWGQPILTPATPQGMGDADFMMLSTGSGCDGKYSPNHGNTAAQNATCFTSLFPAYDSWFSSLANSTIGQTPITPMAYALWSLEGASATSPYFMVEMGLGVGGYSYANLASGQTPYTNLTNAITGAVALMPSGFALNIPAVMYVQGEADTTTTRSTYATDLATMQSNLSTTIKTATPTGTGQSNTPFMLLTQQTDDGGFTTDTQTQAIIGAQSDASYPNSTTIYLVTPLYPFENNAQQSGHLTARGYYEMGEKMAEAYHQIVPAAEGGLNNTTTLVCAAPDGGIDYALDQCSDYSIHRRRIALRAGLQRRQFAEWLM